MMKALIVLSGGQDSSTCLAYVLDQVHTTDVRAVTFDYGQRHAVEVQAARDMIAALANAGRVIPHEVIEVPGILKGTSPLVDKSAAVEQYADAASLPGGLEKTFVPMRNALFATIAGNRAACMGRAGDVVEIYMGVSQEDFGGYPDCREEFIHYMGRALQAACDAPGLPEIRLVTPLLYRSKKQTVEFASSLPFGKLLNGLSHTCYNGQVPPCGKCHACLLRAKGYAEAGIMDPLIERLASLSAVDGSQGNNAAAGAYADIDARR